MKKHPTFVLFLFLSINFNAQIISQYIETSSGTTPKGIEIWNNTSSTLDFSTNNLVIEKGTNGGTPNADFTISSGTLASGDVLVIGTSDMQSETENNGATFYKHAFTFNGDDALVVKYGGTTTDVFGEPGSDPGSAWSGNGVSTANQNISLKSGITDGDIDGWTDPSIRFETTSTDNSLTGFGIAPESATPVELQSFVAKTNGNSVVLNWHTATEVNNYGFEIQRSTEKATWSKIGFVEGNGTSNSPKEYSFTDVVSQSGKYSYRLKQIDIDGSYKYSNVVEVNVVSPEKFELGQNYPNPFNPTTTIEYSIPNVGASVQNVQLKIYDVLGREVATLVNQKQSSGNYKVKFDASKLNSGVYFYTLRAGDFVSTKKMILMK